MLFLQLFCCECSGAAVGLCSPFLFWWCNLVVNGLCFWRLPEWPLDQARFPLQRAITDWNMLESLLSRRRPLHRDAHPPEVRWTDILLLSVPGFWVIVVVPPVVWRTQRPLSICRYNLPASQTTSRPAEIVYETMRMLYIILFFMAYVSKFFNGWRFVFTALIQEKLLRVSFR